MSSEVDLIKERLDIAEIVGEYVSLKRAGHHFKGLCPFHQEKTPSFIVSPSKGIWHCFGCQRGGDIFSFIQEKEGMDFAGALATLAERAGVTLTKHSRVGVDRRQRILDLLVLAARFYHEVLTRQPAGKRALAYMVSERGVQPDMLRRFQVGYAPHRWDALLTFLRSRGYSPTEAQAAGLVGESTGGKLYDRFRGRVMFPIADTQGKIVAFGGRIVPWHATGNEGKYVNSPETELYEKRRIVFNLERAKRVVRQDTPVIVVEGYMDVIMLVQSGVENVVATSGTAFTSEQVSQLARFTKCLHFVFDPDIAGVKAALGATRTALEAGLRVATVLLPAGMDPADLARTNPARLGEYLKKPLSLPYLLMEQLRRSESGTARETWLEELLSTVRLVSNPVQQGEMIQDIAVLLHVPETKIIASLQRPSTVATGRGGIRHAGEKEKNEHHAVPVQPDYLFLGLALISPNVRQMVQKVHSEDAEFFDQFSRALYNFLQGLVNNSQQQFSTMSVDEVLALVPSDLLPFAEALRRLSEERLQNSPEDAEAEATVLLSRIRQRTLEERLQVLHRSLAGGDAAVRESALRQFQVLTEELAHLQTQQ